MYKLAKNLYGGEPCIVIRLSDGANIPFDLANSDYQQYLKDVENGAEVLPADE